MKQHNRRATMSDGEAKPLPPGTSGWPLLGETHLLLRDGFGFVAFLKVFTVELVRAHDWRLAAPQNLDLAWNQVPPMPREGLRVKVTPRAV